MKRISTIAFALVLFGASAAQAVVTFTGSVTPSDGHALSAKATFTLTGTQLVIVLTNTDLASGAYSNPWGLTGLFWDFSGASGATQALTAASATVLAGAIMGACSGTAASSTCPTATQVGGEFGYKKGAYNGGMPTGIGGYGIASSGYLAGESNYFGGGVDLDSPAALDGPNFSIVGKNSLGLTPANPSIKENVTFVLNGVSNISEANIFNVRFQYGTSFSETGINACQVVSGSSCTTSTPGSRIPEPGSLALAGVAFLGLAMTRRRKAAVITQTA